MELGLAAVVAVVLCFLPRAQGQVCHHPVFCNEELLDIVKDSGLFPDMKEFVDRPLLESPDDVLQSLMNAYSRGGADLLQEAVQNLTASPGSDLNIWEPPDWTARPWFVNQIQDDRLQEWAVSLNGIWKLLGRQTSPSVSAQPERHTLLPQPFPFIVPGGRFRESYYWDTFWMVQGLLLGEMESTVQHILQNMASAIMTYGFVPNGGRIYYTGRSQPPLLTQMVDYYYNFTSNLTFVESLLPALSREYEFWMTNRSVNLTMGVFNHYSSPTNGPRPESYVQDITVASQLSPEEQLDFYSAIASAAESGWDFSSRWFEPHSNISSIRTQRVLPVDLNAIMCQNERVLHRLYIAAGDVVSAQYFIEALEERQRFFDALFWNEDRGLWVDRDLDNDGPLDNFYASSLVPLLWQCNTHNVTKAKAALAALQSLHVVEYPGGIPASLVMSGEQWDFPNAWAPHQWFPVVAWAGSDYWPLKEAAREMAETWITSTYSAWIHHNKTMFEKYSCVEQGTPGQGGEYAVQSGFGWTNSVVLYFLWLYPDLMVTDNHTDPTPFPVTSSSSTSSQSLGWVAVPILLVVTAVISVFCGLWCCWLYRVGKRRYWRRVHNEHLRAAANNSSEHRQDRDSSEETDESADDRKGLFSWNT